MLASLERRSAGGRSLALIALSLLALVGIVGLAMDVGRIMAARRELARLTDAAALAAAGALTTLPSERDMQHPRAQARANAGRICLYAPGARRAAFRRV